MRESESQSTASRGSQEDLRLPVPEDCTRSGVLGRLLMAGQDGMATHPKRIILDLVGLRSMNSQLLSTVIYLGGECMRRGISFVLENVPAEFEAWVASHRLSEPIALVATRSPARR